MLGLADIKEATLGALNVVNEFSEVVCEFLCHPEGLLWSQDGCDITSPTVVLLVCKPESAFPCISMLIMVAIQDSLKINYV